MSPAPVGLGNGSVPTSRHRSSDIFTVVATRRDWSPSEKRAILAEMAVPGANVSTVARRYGVAQSLLYRWRKDAAAAERGTAASAPAFVPVAIAKMRRDTVGSSSEHGTKLIDQMELQLGELVEIVAKGQAVAEIAATAAIVPEQKPARRPLPAPLPRERVVHPAAASYPCCGGQLRKLGEDITETLEFVPPAWRVI
jgi:transposase-like protein